MNFKEGAIKCSHCGSFQNWQSRLQSGQLLFGFVLLILTLLALQPVKNLFIGTSPEIQAAILTADAETFTVVISNSGNGLCSIGRH